MTSNHADIWDLLAAELRGAVGHELFDIWLAPLTVARYDAPELLIEAPAQTRAWVADRFGRLLQTSAAAILGDDVRVSVQACAGPASERPSRSAGQHKPAPQPAPIRDDAPLGAKHTFDQFVIGDANRFAHGAALAVAENPGTAYNPLFLCGPPGVGKTHLLHAIGTYLTEHGTGVRVRSTTAEGFANAFIAALQSRSMDAFKQRFRNTDVLLVDDVQFLMAKAKTEEEFFHTFNALRDIGAQVVLTSDRSPADLAALEERLRDRFASGLVAAIAAPDRATRLTVLRKRVALDHLDVAPAILEFLADRVTSNLRGLEAALVRAVAFASLAQEPLTIELATRVLHDLGPAATTTIGRHAPSVEDVQDATCAAFGLTREELLSSTRAARVAWPRQIAMYLAREHTDVSLPAIGVRFGGRGHTTVMHACKRTSARLAADPEASALVMRLSTQLSTTRPGDHADRPD